MTYWTAAETRTWNDLDSIPKTPFNFMQDRHGWEWTYSPEACQWARLIPAGNTQEKPPLKESGPYTEILSIRVHGGECPQ